MQVGFIYTRDGSHWTAPLAPQLRNKRCAPPTRTDGYSGRQHVQPLQTVRPLVDPPAVPVQLCTAPTGDAARCSGLSDGDGGALALRPSLGSSRSLIWTLTSLRDAGRLHGHAVEHVGHLHGRLAVRDDDELRVRRSSRGSSRSSDRCSPRRAARRPRRGGRTGLGLYWKIAKISETAVSAFSPPLISSIEVSFLPGGCAMISMPVSSMSSGFGQLQLGAVPPPNMRGKICWKRVVDLVEGLAEQLLALAVHLPDRRVELLERRARGRSSGRSGTRSACCAPRTPRSPSG